MNLSFLAPSGFSKLNSQGIYEIPFLDRVAIVFIICLIGMYLISKFQISKGVVTNGLEVDRSMFKPGPSFITGSLLVCGILAALYCLFW